MKDVCSGWKVEKMGEDVGFKSWKFKVEEGKFDKVLWKYLWFRWYWWVINIYIKMVNLKFKSFRWILIKVW